MKVEKYIIIFALVNLICYKAFAGETAANKREIEIISLFIDIEEEDCRINIEESATGLAPNEVGDIMVIMYHKIVEGEPESDMERSVKDFENDLNSLYENGYRPIKMTDFANNKISVEYGYTPVVITFDDGYGSAFSLEENNGELKPAENCAVDIMNRFSAEKVNFGKYATFFINGVNTFKGGGKMEERLNYLVENGFELGNHTYSHYDLKSLSKSEICSEIAALDQYVKEYLPDYNMEAFCYPYGSRPKDDDGKLKCLSGEESGYGYEYKLAFNAGPGGVSAPNGIGFDKLNIPRVRGSNNAELDFGWYLDYYKSHPEKRYISDGDADTISVEAKNLHLVNEDSLKGKTLKIYEENHG